MRCKDAELHSSQHLNSYHLFPIGLKFTDYTISAFGASNYTSLEKPILEIGNWMIEWNLLRPKRVLQGN